MNYLFDIESLFKEFEETINLLININFNPDVTIIAGSGINQSLLGLEIVKCIKFRDLPGFIDTQVEGQNKEIIFGFFENRRVLVFNGRFHIYEGIDIKYVISPIIISYFLGVKNIILTNATGGLNPLFRPGDIMIIDSVINLMNRKIIFNHQYDNEINKINWNRLITNKLIELNQYFNKGIYVGLTGPSYETSSEIKMLRIIGADAVGMSIVHELTLAKYLNINVTGCSLITNTLTETNTKELTHNEVLEIAEKSKYSIYNFFKSALGTINEIN